jgi:hypothetical protein
MNNKNNNKRTLGELINTCKKQKVNNGNNTTDKSKVSRALAIKDKSIQLTKEQVKEALTIKGYAVVPSNFTDKGVREGCRSLIDKDVGGFREFRDSTGEGDNVDRSPLGGFGVYNNPSSFHCRTVRDIRNEVYNELSPTIDFLKEFDTQKKEFVIDRLMIRPAGSSTSPEMWHRDESPGALGGDTVFGGWLNLDNSQQLFSCVPGTHRSVDVENASGFGLIRKKELINEYNQKRTKVSIPPGHILIFNENIIHEVVSSTRRSKSYRLFTSWRLTYSETPIVEGLDEMLERQAAITVKSGQLPAMWAKLHWTNWVEKLERYSTNFRPECLETAIIKSGRNAGRGVVRVHRHMKSLVDYGFPLYEPYTPEERSIYFPH